MALVAVLTLFCIGFVCYSSVEASGGVRARAWQAAAPQQHSSWSFGGVHGVGGGANECSALVLCATAASRLVAASALEHGKLRLPSSKVRGRLVACMALVAVLTIVLHWFCVLQQRRGWWRRPSSSMASCGWPAA
ncbi:hypothetical protein PF003_g29803 [Phytophthora fragariae]|nr:hypothetical protein PF003_g29803 [Phytophthora fragariae]